METKNETPMMKLFRELKSKHPEALLLFRCGDFYEAYEEDARECAKVLGITLTKHTSDGTYMAGFPHHALDTYLPKLIRAGKRVAICDQLEPPTPKVKRGITETFNNNLSKNKETMANKTMTAQDYVGKVIIVGENIASITIKSAEGDTLNGEFKKGDAPAIPMPIKLANLEKMIADKVWKLGLTPDSSPKGEGSSKTSTESTEAPSNSPGVGELPKSKTDKPKSKPSKPKSKTDKPKSKTEKTEDKQEAPVMGSLKYETYVNKKGKTCAKIVGFTEDDAAYKEAASIHASASYTKDKKGNKTLYLCFGPRYAAAAKDVCDALNAGKTLADCQAIIDKATEERQQKREEWKAKRAAARTEKAEKVYTEKEVADLIKRVVAGDAEAMRIVNEMAA